MSEDNYPWSDAYSSDYTYDYDWMLQNIECPLHGTAGECPCTDPSLNSTMRGASDADR